MKFESNFHGSRKIIFFLLIFLFLHPCLVFSEETYKSYFEKAQSFDKDDFFEDAIEYWQKTLDANPPSNIALYVQLKLAHTYSRLGRLDKAATISKTLTQTNPDNYDSWFHLANALAGLQQYPQAVEAFKKTTALKVDEGLGRVGLAFAYFGDKKPDLAIEELKKAMKTFKSNKNISWHRDCRLGVCRT